MPSADCCNGMNSFDTKIGFKHADTIPSACDRSLFVYSQSEFDPMPILIWSPLMLPLGLRKKEITIDSSRPPGNRASSEVKKDNIDLRQFNSP